LDEPRRTPRAICRLHCLVRADRGDIRARIVDVSESGLCLFSPVWIDPKSKIEIAIDVPGIPDSIVEAEVWHVRREKVAKSSRKIWVIGVMLDKADDGYVELLRAAGLATTKGAEASIHSSGRTASDSRDPRSSSTAVGGKNLPGGEIEPRVFRIRVQARTGPRTRLLTLTADTEEDAQATATRDLERDWRIIEIIAA